MENKARIKKQNSLRHRHIISTVYTLIHHSSRAISTREIVQVYCNSNLIWDAPTFLSKFLNVSEFKKRMRFIGVL